MLKSGHHLTKLKNTKIFMNICHYMLMDIDNELLTSSYKEIDVLAIGDYHFIKDTVSKIRQASHINSAFPLAIELVENPKYSIFKRNIIFIPGAVSSWLHDAIHLALGRGFLPQDEAFVIGYTMGSTKQYGHLAKILYKLASTKIYPKKYRFTEREINILNYAANVGKELSPVNVADLKYSDIQDWSIKDLRDHIVGDWEALLASYRLEFMLYGDNKAIRRIIDKI